MPIQLREIYASANGDRWYLALEPRSGRVFIRHEPNAASGGETSLIEVAEFLAQGDHGLQHAELLHLIGTLVDQGSAGTDETGGE